jgi:two-component system sensor histidine kinase CpxA
MEHATTEIAHGRFATRVGLTRSDELGRLSSAIDAMAGRLDAMVTGQKRFLGDTAHELRSPLGRMQVALEILDRQAADADRAYIADLKEDVDALSRMTDELLQFARADLADRSAPLEPVHLAPVIERIIAKEGQGHAFSTTVPDNVVVHAYPQLLERHAGPITIAGAVAGENTVISVADLGPGVDATEIDRIFEPFYRADAARNRKTGGVGLGLAIVRSAIEACGGTVSCANRQPHGLDVRMTLSSATNQPGTFTPAASRNIR